MSTLPFPLIDHVIVNARAALDEEAERWTRLGFQLTPRGHHTLGSSNNLAVLGTDYIELLGVLGDAQRGDVLDWPAGLNGLVFKTIDSDGMHRSLTEAGMAPMPMQAFSRPVDMGDGRSLDASFRTVRLPREASPAGRMFFCHHLTPELVWHDPWRRHPNGAIGVAGFDFASPDPGRYATLFAGLFGADMVRRVGDAVVLAAGLATVTVSPGDAERMTALTLRTASLARAASCTGTAPAAGRVSLDAGGFTLAFME